MRYGSDKVSFLLIDGYSVLGSTTELKDNIEAMIEEAHALGDNMVRHGYVGLKKATLEQNGFYNDEVNGVHDALKSYGESRILNYGVEGNVLGKQAMAWSGALQVNYERIVSRGAFHRANAKYEVSGETEKGLILKPLTYHEGDGNTEDTPLEGSQTTDGAAFYLQVTQLDLDGLANVKVQIRQYDMVNGWEDLPGAEFTIDDDTKPYAERIFIEGTIKTDLAVKWSFTGLDTEEPSITFTIIVKRR